MSDPEFELGLKKHAANLAKIAADAAVKTALISTEHAWALDHAYSIAQNTEQHALEALECSPQTFGSHNVFLEHAATMASAPEVAQEIPVHSAATAGAPEEHAADHVSAPADASAKTSKFKWSNPWKPPARITSYGPLPIAGPLFIAAVTVSADGSFGFVCSDGKTGTIINPSMAGGQQAMDRFMQAAGCPLLTNPKELIGKPWPAV